VDIEVDHRSFSLLGGTCRREEKSVGKPKAVYPNINSIIAYSRRSPHDRDEILLGFGT
jgi:hypothetical protein